MKSARLSSAFTPETAARYLCAVVKRIMVLGFGVQIVLGLVWLCSNFGSVQDFPESASAAYRLLYTLTGKRPQLLYAVQLGVALWAADRFLTSLCRTQRRLGERLFGALALLTFPMALQSHLALLAWSLCGSAVLLEWSFFTELLRCGQEKTLRLLGGMLLCWAASALLLPEYRLLGAVPVLLVLPAVIKRHRREPGKLALRLVLVLLGGCLAAGLGLLAVRASGEKPRSLWYALACRTAWPTILSDHGMWPEEVQEALGERVIEMSFYPDNMDRIMRPLMEETFGAKQADVYYRRIAGIEWERRGRNILTQVRWDIVGYAMTPAILPKQLEGGKYESCSARNYEIMRQRLPVLTKVYVHYSCGWFLAAVCGSAVLTVLCIAADRESLKRCGLGGWLLPAASAAFDVLWYTMQGAGLMDYKATFAVGSLWLAWALTAMQEERRIER